MQERKQENEEIITRTDWVDDGKGGVKPVEVKYRVKDKGDSQVLTPVKTEEDKKEEH